MSADLYCSKDGASSFFWYRRIKDEMKQTNKKKKTNNSSIRSKWDMFQIKN